LVLTGLNVIIEQVSLLVDGEVVAMQLEYVARILSFAILNL